MGDRPRPPDIVFELGERSAQPGSVVPGFHCVPGPAGALQLRGVLLNGPGAQLAGATTLLVHAVGLLAERRALEAIGSPLPECSGHPHGNVNDHTNPGSKERPASIRVGPPALFIPVLRPLRGEACLSLV